MKIRLLGVIIGLATLLGACATADYGTFTARGAGSFTKTEIAVSDTGLSRDAISAILATKFPPAKKVAISLLFMARDRAYARDLSMAIIDRAKGLPFIDKVVPVPSVMLPAKITFEAIQQVGIRSLCEYTLLFYNDSDTLMSFTQFIKGEFVFQSDLEFALVDNQTTAIIATDRLVSRVTKKSEFFNDKVIEEAKREVFAEQSSLLAQKLTALFK